MKYRTRLHGPDGSSDDSDNTFCGRSEASKYPHQLAHGKDLVDGRDVFLLLKRVKSAGLRSSLCLQKYWRNRGRSRLQIWFQSACNQQGLGARSCRDLFAEFAGGTGISVGVMSPQMLRGRHMGKLLSEAKTKALVRWMLIDEETMRPRLPTATIWATTTDTATLSAALRITSGLGFQSGQYVNARYSIDRPNVKVIPRFFEHPTSAFQLLDLSFVICFGMKHAREIAPTLIFVKTIRGGYDLLNGLDSLIPADVLDRLRIIKLYNSPMPIDYRRQFIADSALRIGIVTGTCTYLIFLSSRVL
ncbi:hypothetical protein C8F04DRAFT_1265926 [Mycena alexandri]|uniref:Uncharacterized protein n=1 Tax=Mycena alexandri TaxID=1745969 RepID=A0AAD6SK93_9AGAR|nr:hypothetical protein C8F04DRAFT_1265926 [Mycena alexandri]